MKKFLFMMSALLSCFTTIFAQSDFVATLQHGDSIVNYYGMGALELAYDASDNGDVITLSAGSFTFSKGLLEKGVTLRGNGIDAENRTFITDDIKVYSKNKNKTTTMEGIYFTGKVDVYNSLSEQGQGTINIIKCSSDRVQAYADSLYSNEGGPKIRLYNCIIRSWAVFNSNTFPNMQFLNCYVAKPYSYEDVGTNMSAFVNCIINYRYNPNIETNSYYYSNDQNAYHLNFTNCIFIFDVRPSDSCYLPNNATANHCLAVMDANNYSLFTFSKIVDNSTNKYSNKLSAIFKSYRAGCNKGEKFELTETAASTYLGNDGTQIGMHGGLYPYTTEVQYPVITKLKANHTDKDGKLSVEVGVDGK